MKPSEECWAILFEDADVAPEIFTDEHAAKKRYEEARENWSCHLLAPYQKVQDLQSATIKVADLGGKAAVDLSGRIAALEAENAALKEEVKEQDEREAKWAKRFDQQVGSFAVRLYNSRKRRILIARRRISGLREENAMLHEDKARLVEALKRVRTHGIGGSDCYDYLEAQAMATWIDAGCVGPLPEIVSPFVRASIDAARKGGI